jgi:hypothetical protein
MTPTIARTAHIDALHAVCEHYGVETLNFAYCSTEDLAPYLRGELPVGRFVAITEAVAEDFFYATPCATRELAIVRAFEFVCDSIYPEDPVAVVDLDTGFTEGLTR